MNFVIAIDGPAAAGKGTIAVNLADKFKFSYLDTGLLYRAVAAKSLDEGIEPHIAAFGLTQIDLNRQNLRDPIISKEASKIATLSEVRSCLKKFQIDFSNRPGGAILDGRDIGTVICPKADLKFFIFASTEVRALRRYKELISRGIKIDLKKVTEDIVGRDKMDSRRNHSPLRQAPDAILIDTSFLTIREAIEKVEELVKHHLTEK